MNRLLLILLTSAFIFSAPTPGLLIPIGGGYSDIYAGFSQAAVANAKDGTVKILVLATPYSTNAISITEAERATNLKDAEERRFQIESACKRAASPQQTCQAILAPIFTRSDAENPVHLSLFTTDLAAIFILGGDQTVGMQVLIGTPIETRLEELHQSGVIVAGTSAGGGMQAKAMLAGYNQNYAAETSLFFGASDIWNSPEKHGLTFGLQTAILDQHFYQRARFGRLLNAIVQPGVPHLGVGVDAYTGVTAENEILRDVFGLYTVTVLDAETYHAAEGVKYVSLEATRPPLLSARNLLVSILSPGQFSYNLKTRTSSLAAPAPRLERRFETLTLPKGAGSLILAGGLADNLENNAILARFVELSGRSQANLLVIADGGASVIANERLAQKYAEALIGLGAKVSLWVADANGIFHQTPAPEVTGFILVGNNASKMTPPAWVKEYWLAGKPILADNAAAALLGSFYSAHGPTPNEAEEAELATQKSFRQGKTNLQPGLGPVNITLEPQMLADNRFGRWFSLAYNHPQLLALGLNQGTAIEIGPEGARAIGQNGIFVLDLRKAKLALGVNDGFVIANGLLDLFAPGEALQPELADLKAQFTPAATPVVLLVETPTLAPTITPAPTRLPPSTATTAPTATSSASEGTPVPASPPANSSLLWVLLIGLVLAIGAVLAANLLKKRQ